MIGIEWDKKFELGHERIDFEHRVFLDLIRSISRLGDKDADPARLVRTLSELQKYAEFHFLSEENLMEDIRYPGIEEHRYEHRILLAHLSEMINDSLNQRKSLDDIVDFLFRWFALHTTQVDKRLTRYIEEQGATTAND